jgi:multidrug resistance efflux pump
LVADNRTRNKGENKGLTHTTFQEESAMTVGPHPASANGPPKPTPPAKEAPPKASLGRRIRVALGWALLGISGWLGVCWLLSPSLWNITSSQAVVNARIMTLHPPIEGTVAESPPPVGQAVTAGSPLLRIENPLADDSHVEELKTEAASLRQRVAALKKQYDGLEALKRRLKGNVRKYQAAAVRRLERRLEEAKALAAATDAFVQQRRYKRQQAELLVRGNSVSKQDAVTARLAAEAARSKAAQTQAVVRRLSDELEALRSGLYLGQGDAGNDVPYSQQRVHDLEIRQHDITAKIEEFAARAAQLRKQLRIETERLGRHQGAVLRAPIDGVVWRRPVKAGSPVTRQTPVLQLLDASDIFVDALVPAKYVGDIRPGDKVVIELIGAREQLPGTVQDVLGQVALAEDRALAAEVPKLAKREVHVLVAFDGEPPNRDRFHPYHIGQPVEVRFAHRTGLLQRLFNLVLP